MTAALLFPAGLAALAALALPLLIHLARRTEERATPFAALRWLQPKPRPRSRPRLDERLLLFARLLLLAALALGLAQPVLSGGSDSPRWVAVAPGVDQAAARALVGGGARAVWLAPGLPDLSRSPPTGAIPLPSLLRELDADLPGNARLSVLVPAVLQGADAERPRLAHRIDWRALPGAMPAPQPTPAAPISLAVRYAQSEADGLRYLRAAEAAWRTSTQTPPGFSAAPLSAPLPEAAATIVWLAPGPVPAAVLDRAARGAVVLTGSQAEVVGAGPSVPVWRDALGRPLVEAAALGRGRVLSFTRPLDPAVMPELLEPDFPARLRTVLADPAPPPARVEAQDYAPIAGGRPGAPPAQDLRPALAGIVVALFAVERWLATRRRRASTP